MELVLPMYNVHPYFSLKNLGKEVCIIHSNTVYVSTSLIRSNLSCSFVTPNPSPAAWDCCLVSSKMPYTVNLFFQPPLHFHSLTET